MLDKWAFGMSKIEGDDGKSGKASTSVEKDALMMKRPVPPSQATDLAQEVSQVSLDTRGSYIGRGPAQAAPGPSLLSQTNPNASRPMPVPSKSADPLHQELPPGSVMSIDRDSDEGSSSMYEAMAEKITVKIADLGNGGLVFLLCWFVRSVCL